MIAVDLVIVISVVGGILGLLAARSLRAQQRNDLVNSPVYKLTRRMANELERVLIHDTNFPMLTEAQRSNIRALLHDWEKQL